MVRNTHPSPKPGRPGGSRTGDSIRSALSEPRSWAAGGIRGPRGRDCHLGCRDAVTVERHDDGGLPDGWDHPGLRVARAFGDAWIRERRTAVLVVPSVVARREGDLLINRSTRSIPTSARSSPALRNRWSGTLGCAGHGSKLRANLSACCPDREHFQHIASDSEVQPVLRLGHQVPANLNWPPGDDPLAETRVVDKDEEDTLKVQTNRTGRCRPVLSPPRGGSFDLATGASLDDVA